MDSVPLAVACIPLAIYLLWLALVNLRRRPFVTSGASDMVRLALAVSGLLIVGPLNLFMPQGAVVRFGPLVWSLVLGFYGLCVLLYLLAARPRLVIYNITLPEFRPVFDQLLPRLDSAARTAGDAVHLPQLNVQFHFDSTAGMRNVSLISTGDRQSHSGWQRLHRELNSALRTVEVSPNPCAFTFLAIAIVLIGWPTVQLLQTPSQRVAQEWRDLFRK